MDAILEVLENIVEHLFVLGVDSEACDGSRTAITDGALFHDERLGDGCDDTKSAAAALRWSGHCVSRPQH